MKNINSKIGWGLVIFLGWALSALGQVSFTGGGAANPTNLMPIANAPDFWKPVSLFSTNNVVQFQACTNVDITKTIYQGPIVVFVTNTTPATPRAIIAPINCRTSAIPAFGIPFVTNLTRVTFEQYGQKWTNMEAKPVF